MKICGISIRGNTVASRKELKEGQRVIFRSDTGDVHGVVVDNLSSMYFIELDDGSEVFIAKGDASIKKEK